MIVSNLSSWNAALGNKKRSGGAAFDVKIERSWRRACNWGILIVTDPDAEAETPELSGEEIVATPTMLVIPVRHAQDVDFSGMADDEITPVAEVSVCCIVGACDSDYTRAEYVGVMMCQSGRLAIGDAEAEELFNLPRGPIRIAIEREPREFADRVTAWLHI